MAELYNPDFKIENLRKYLESTEYDKIVIKTSRVSGGWHDNEFDANRAGFRICKFIDENMAKNHEFAECYLIVRNK